MSAGYYITLISVVIVGGILGRFTTSLKAKTIDQILTFSAAFLFGIIAVHLIPLVGRSQHSYIGVCILVGFLAQLFLETLTEGVEHGHQHKHLGQKIWPLILGLSIHAFLEGLPLEFYSDMEGHHDHVNPLFWAILAHKLPAAFTLGLLMSGINLKGLSFYLPLLLFAFATPLGAALPSVLPLSEDLKIIAISVVIGFMLHIATTILYESDKEHKSKDPKKIALLILGMGLAALSSFWH